MRSLTCQQQNIEVLTGIFIRALLGVYKAANGMTHLVASTLLCGQMFQVSLTASAFSSSARSAMAHCGGEVYSQRVSLNYAMKADPVLERGSSCVFDCRMTLYTVLQYFIRLGEQLPSSRPFERLLVFPLKLESRLSDTTSCQCRAFQIFWQIVACLTFSLAFTKENAGQVGV